MSIPVQVSGAGSGHPSERGREQGIAPSQDTSMQSLSSGGLSAKWVASQAFSLRSVF